MTYSRVSIVDSVDLTLSKSNPPTLVIQSTGRVPSTGWTDPQLGRHIHITPPADGIQAFDFVADGPDGGIHIPVVTPTRAELVAAAIDVDNYWGAGIPLKGVRVHAIENAKTAMFAAGRGMPGARLMDAPAAALSFETDIKPLFRPRDANVMRGVAGFDLHVYDDVKANADAILARLTDGSMPCDGAWPQADVDRFRNWMDAGMAA